MDFIKDVWGGHDYIPHVWDHWIRDKENPMFVVVVGGLPVGMNRLRFLEDGSAWFEGARIHPAYRGRGLASKLGENSMKEAESRGTTIFRLTSGSSNHAAHRQIARIRFREVGRFSVYEPSKGGKPGRGAKRAKPDAVSEILSLLRNTREYRLGGGVFWHNFAAASLTPTVVRTLVGEGAVWTLGRAVAVTRGGGEGSRAWEQICFIGGPQEEAIKLVKSLIGRKKRATERWVFVPQGSPIIHELRKSGFKRTFSNILFERKAAKG